MRPTWFTNSIGWGRLHSEFIANQSSSSVCGESAVRSCSRNLRIRCVSDFPRSPKVLYLLMDRGGASGDLKSPDRIDRTSSSLVPGTSISRRDRQHTTHATQVAAIYRQSQTPPKNPKIHIRSRIRTGYGRVSQYLTYHP